MIHEKLKVLLAEYLESKDASKIHMLFDQALQHDRTEQMVPTEQQRIDQTVVLSDSHNTPPAKQGAVYSSDSQNSSPPLPEDPFEDFPEMALPPTSADKRKSAQQEAKNKFGYYQRQGLLGKGGMGMVWRVKDLKLNRTMALKVMRGKYARDLHKRKEFTDEAQITSQLQHPGIVPIYDFNRFSNGNMYFTMREIEGRTLKNVIKSVHKANNDGFWRSASDGWSLRRLINAFHSVCETVAYAHSRGVIHRDLKPSNIMIGDFGEVLVVDWGIAKVLPARMGRDDLPKQVETNRSMMNDYNEYGFTIGTPVYMSPEQSWGDSDRVDEKSDIFSLGVILYEILTGEIPYKGSVQEILDFKRGGMMPMAKPLSANHPGDKLQDESDHDEDPSNLTFGVKDWPLSPAVGTSSLTMKQSLASGVSSNLEDLFVSYSQIPQTGKRTLPKELVGICEKAMQHDPSNRYHSASDLANEVQSWLEGAQRREKALAIVGQANELGRESIKKQTSGENTWNQADDLITRDGVSSSAGWDLWTKSNRLSKESDDLRHEAQQLLQGALIYDPELVEIHRRLIKLEYDEFLNATLRADVRASEKALRRIGIHLENLSDDDVAYWHTKQSRDFNAINLLRKGHGVFVGRRQQQQNIRYLLRNCRLLSLVGTAGVGKTHLAIEAAAKWRDEYEKEVLFCDLTMANDAMGMAQILGQTLQLALHPQKPWQAIEKDLNNRGNILLVLDNIEQIVDDAGEVIENLLARTVHLQVMVTSRVKLGISREKLVQVETMSILEGVELFVRKAQKALPDFALSQSNRIIVGEIVEKLDMLPLAIELAAARISMLSVEQIAERLSQRFELLRSRLRERSQRALQGALDWSWDLLTGYAQSALAQCSAFRGGFDVKAAEEIVDLSTFDQPPAVIDVVEALCDDNLLLKERQDNGRFRYSMLLSIHEYASQKRTIDCLDSDIRSRVPERHAKYYGAFFQAALELPVTQRSGVLLIELENFISGVKSGLPNDAFLCCQAAMRHFRLRGPMSSGIEISASYLSREDLYPDIEIPIRMKRITCLRVAGKVHLAREEMSKVLSESEDDPDVATEVPSTDTSNGKVESFPDKVNR